MSTELELWESYGPLFSYEERNVFVPDGEELEFYRMIRRQYPGTCLELGAGDGRLTSAIAGEELTVALEPSSAMLDCWPEEDRSKVSRVRAVAQSVPLARSSMDLVLFPYNGLHCILDRRERLRVLKGISELLGEEGVFVSETCPHFADRPDEENALRYSFRRSGDSLRLVESVLHSRGDLCGNSGRICFDMVYTGTVVPGGHAELRLELALISAGELLEDLRSSGLDIITVWGDYDLSPWDGESSPRLLVKAGRSSV